MQFHFSPIKSILAQRYLWLFILFFPAVHVSAQDEELLNRLNPDKSLYEQLPPLDTLIKIAVAYHPTVKLNEELIGSAKARVAMEKYNWLNWLSGFFNYSFGNQAIITTGSTPSDLGTIANGYRFGVNLSMPIGDVMNRKNRKVLTQHELRATQYKTEEMKLVISEQVILVYNTLLLNYKMLGVRFEMMEKSKLNFRLAESEFKASTMDAASYSRIGESYTSAISEYENVKKSFFEAAQKMELLLGTKLKYLIK